MRKNDAVEYRISEAARLLNVSDDTARRWVASGRLEAVSGDGPLRIDGRSLARLAESLATEAASVGSELTTSARNRFAGIVIDVQRDGVMARVDLVCGPNRVVSLMTAEAADELGLAPGVAATAVVKATTVTVQPR
ncbi:MAG: TOBE domain-containing protein [Actinobacteria bacterium]|nr:TOBE domain-containing protein [Actinomycetota bacterium]